MNNFFKTLLNIISNSPSSVLFIIIGIIFAASMIINIKNKNKNSKIISILGWLFVISFIIIRYISYLNKLFDNLINNIFMQIFFPNLATYIIIILITNIIFLYTVLSKNIKNSSKIFNIIFYTIITILMFYTLEQIIVNDVNIYQFDTVYSNSNLTTLVQCTTLLFTLWIIIIINKLIINKLITKSINNIKDQTKDDIDNDDIEILDV